MAIIELKLFISIILPLAAMLLIIRGEARTVMVFLLLGLLAELVSNYLESFLFRFAADASLFSVNITPAVEEIFKALPVLVFVFRARPEKQLILEASIAVGIGFAILENAFMIAADAYAVSLSIAFLRGIGTGMMHAVCTLAVGYGMSFLSQKRWFFFSGTFLFLFMAMVYHAIFNILVQSQYEIVGFVLPMVTFIPILIVLLKTGKIGK